MIIQHVFLVIWSRGGINVATAKVNGVAGNVAARGVFFKLSRWTDVQTPEPVPGLSAARAGSIHCLGERGRRRRRAAASAPPPDTEGQEVRPLKVQNKRPGRVC